MIGKLSEYKITNRDGDFINVECNTKIINTLVRKINELVDVVNKQQDIIRQIGEWGRGKGECLWCATLTEFNPTIPQDPMVGCTTYVKPDDDIIYKKD